MGTHRPEPPSIKEAAATMMLHHLFCYMVFATPEAMTICREYFDRQGFEESTNRKLQDICNLLQETHLKLRDMDLTDDEVFEAARILEGL